MFVQFPLLALAADSFATFSLCITISFIRHRCLSHQISDHPHRTVAIARERTTSNSISATCIDVRFLFFRSPLHQFLSVWRHWYAVLLSSWRRSAWCFKHRLIQETTHYAARYWSFLSRFSLSRLHWCHPRGEDKRPRYSAPITVVYRLVAVSLHSLYILSTKFFSYPKYWWSRWNAILTRRVPWHLVRRRLFVN